MNAAAAAVVVVVMNLIFLYVIHVWCMPSFFFFQFYACNSLFSCCCYV